jgi:hypothetical protein
MELFDATKFALFLIDLQLQINERIGAYLKKGISSFVQLNSLVAVYNANALKQ